MAIEKRKLLLDIWGRLPIRMPAPSNVPIDVVIPVIEKDLGILPLCLRGIKSQITNNIKDIYIVAPSKQKIVDFCKDNNIIFVEETTVLGFGPQKLNLLVETEFGTKNRSGWLFQQLIKLSGNIGTCDYYVTVDSDHILLRPHTFLDKSNKSVLYLSEEKNPPYREFIHKLLPKSNITLNPFSYVSHKMIFGKKELKFLQNEITRQNGGKYWVDAILSCYDRRQISGFSEFELYGNTLSEKRLRPWKQKELTYDALDQYDLLKTMFSKEYLSITFPEWKQSSIAK